jgi:hypothetical protein
VARLEDNWWKLGFTDGRLGRSARSAQNILHTTAAFAFDDRRTVAESNLKAREAELEHVRQQLGDKSVITDELLEFRQHLNGAKRRKTTHGILVPYFYLIAGTIALFADIALSGNLVTEGFKVKDGRMFWSMVFGFAVFGVFLKAGLTSLLRVWHERREFILKVFWCVSLVLMILTLFVVSSYRGKVEVRTQLSIQARQRGEVPPVATSEENSLRSLSFIALCLSLPLAAGGLIFIGSILVVTVQVDLSWRWCWCNAEEVAQFSEDADDGA